MKLLQKFTLVELVSDPVVLEGAVFLLETDAKQPQKLLERVDRLGLEDAVEVGRRLLQQVIWGLVGLVLGYSSLYSCLVSGQAYLLLELLNALVT